MKRAIAAVHESGTVKVCGCRPHDGGAADTGAGVRKPPMEETAMGERMMVPRTAMPLAAAPYRASGLVHCDAATCPELGVDRK
jgi:hypothetical protein